MLGRAELPLPLIRWWGTLPFRRTDQVARGVEQPSPVGRRRLRMDEGANRLSTHVVAYVTICARGYLLPTITAGQGRGSPASGKGHPAHSSRTLSYLQAFPQPPWNILYRRAHWLVMGNSVCETRRQSTGHHYLQRLPDAFYSSRKSRYVNVAENASHARISGFGCKRHFN